MTDRVEKIAWRLHDGELVSVMADYNAGKMTADELVDALWLKPTLAFQLKVFWRWLKTLFQRKR